jgi:hypothetical protein
MLVAALIGALFGVESGRVMPLDPATLRPVGRGEAIAPMRGPVAWSPGRRLAIAVRPAGRVRIVGERTVDTGTDAAFLAWAGRRLVAVGSDGAVAGGQVPTPVESAVSAGEHAVVLSRGSLAFISANGAIRNVALPGVAHAGLAASSRAAYVADAGGVLEVTPDGTVTRRLMWARPSKGSEPWRTAALLGDTLVVAGCDKPVHSGCVRPSGLRLIDTRRWTSRVLDSQASWFKRAGRHIVVERDGLRVYTADGILRVHALRGRDVAAQVGPTHAYAHIIGAVGSRTRAIDLRTGAVRMLPARVPYLL